MAALHTLGVAEGVALTRQGEVSPVAIAEACLVRIEALEPALQAWVTLDREGHWRQSAVNSRFSRAKTLGCWRVFRWGSKIFFTPPVC